MFNLFGSTDHKLIKKFHKLDKEISPEEYLEFENDMLKKVTVIENHEPLISIKDNLNKDIFINLANLNIKDSNDDDRMFLRKKVVAMLNKAQTNLPKGFHLLIKDAFRSEDLVWKMYNKYFEEIKKRKPELSDKEIETLIRNKLAMPDDIVPPGHMTGGAVDVILCDGNQNVINTRVPNTNTFSDPKHQYTFAKDLPLDIQKNRMILFKALTQAGFSNFFKEYWHYSYGDAYWALRRKKKVAFYGIPEINK